MHFFNGLPGNLIVAIQLLFSAYLLIPFLFYCYYVVSKKVGLRERIHRMPVITKHDFQFNIVITAHQEVAFINPLLDSLQKQTYKRFQAFVVADQIPLSISFDSAQVKTIHPSSPLNSKIDSIALAMKYIEDPSSVVIILDSDNLLHPAYLEVMNNYFQRGYKVVQSDFKAKNTETPIALMDAVGDLYNFFVDREMRMELGFSSAIWGAGIAFERKLYEGISYLDNLGGFDKQLQIHLASAVERIAFAREAILYDEKIIDSVALQRQRTRWISAQMKYMRQNLKFFLLALVKLDFNRIYFGFANIRPPLFMTIGTAILLMFLDIFWKPWLSLYWLASLLIFVFGFILIVRLKTNEMRYKHALQALPQFIISQVLASLQLGKAKKSFMKTTHHHPVYIDEVLNRNK
jgi:cellulose synthase/poly-beta-1,6-N-acetylglucosamine synthase-like glycosyltransferase